MFPVRQLTHSAEPPKPTCLPHRRRSRAGTRHPLLFRVVFRTRWSLTGQHRKVMPTASERLVWGFGDGSTMPVFDTRLGKIGAVICWENYLPLMRAAMYAKGIGNLLRAHSRCPRFLDSFPAPHCSRETMLRAALQPFQSPARLPRSISFRVW